MLRGPTITDPTLEPTVNPTNNPTMEPTGFPTNDPTVEPTMDPTAFPTSYPTSKEIITRNYSLILDSDYDALEKHTGSNKTAMKQVGLELVESGIGYGRHPSMSQIRIHILNVRRGSVIIDYTLSGNNEGLLEMAASNMNSSIGTNMSIGNMTFGFSSHAVYVETSIPTESPSTMPTVYPSTDPSADPTNDPTADPTVYPTATPTRSPTAGNVFCGERIEEKENGQWEYYLHVENDSIVILDTCSSYLNLFSMRIYEINLFNMESYAECIECGSICFEPLQFTVAMKSGTYHMVIDEKHAVQIICAPEPHPTTEPTDPLSTDSPTFIPSSHPTDDPTTAYPTKTEIVVNVTFGGDGTPIPSDLFLSDPFGRFEVMIVLNVKDESEALGDILECKACFLWQYRSGGEGEWKAIQHEENNDISVTIARSFEQYTVKLIVQSIRRLNAGNCVDEVLGANHLFQPDMGYELRLKFERATDLFYVAETSNALHFSTNGLPSGGLCIIQNVEHLLPLEPYNLFCAYWENEENLEYNALIGDVAMSTAGFVGDARELTGIAPVGNVSITVLVKEQNEYNAITCYSIKAHFKSVEEVISDLSSKDNVTSTEVVEEILITIENITTTSSLSENPDMAVSIHSVVEDMFNSNLTTESEAEQIVDDMVVNILETSAVVSSSNESSTNITGEAIITELATVSSITSNEEIVDTETTTTQLVEEYLPDIFEAVDIFIEESSAENISQSSNTSSVRAEIQDALYSIGEQSQELISNLEATLVEAVAVAVAVSIDNTSNVTDEDIESINSLSESLVDFATLAASTALAQSDVGESFNFEETEVDDNGTVISSKVVSCTKFDADLISSERRPGCGSRAERIELPSTFVEQQQGAFDCAFMSSTRNNFLPRRGRNIGRNQKSSSIVTANIYGSRSPGSLRRRRLTELMEYNTSQCFPYLISIQLSNSTEYALQRTLNESSNFPLCDFWNTNDSYWDTSGCFVHDITNDSVICGCTHLTTFSLSGDEIIPEANVLTEIDWRNLTIENLMKYPTVV